MAKIIEFPNVRNLRDEVKELRYKVINLVFDHDDLKAHKAYEIEYKYNKEFGIREYKLVNLHMTYRKLKEENRQIDFFTNLGQPIDFQYVSDYISDKFSINEKRISEKLARMNAIDSFINKRVVSAKDFMDINKAYKKVIDKINPLLNINSEAETDLYIKVLEAFSNYDLDFVLSVSNMLDNSFCNYFLFTNNMLNTEKLRLEKLIE